MASGGAAATPLGGGAAATALDGGATAAPVAGASLERAALPADTKAKLTSMTAGLDDFAHLLRDGSRQRKEKEEHRLAELKASIAVVERDVAAETEKRKEMGAALQEWAKTQMQAISARVDASINASKAEMAAQVAGLHDRLHKLEETFEADREKTLADIKARNEALTASLKEFSAAFEAERHARLERERALLERLSTYEHESVARFDTERHEREQVYMAAKRKLEEGVAARAKDDGRFQASVLEEIGALKNAVAAEEKARIAEDDDIAANINAYVQKLQASLALMLSEDATY